MRIDFTATFAGLALLLGGAIVLHADEVNMQNGDRYMGKVVSVSADTVVLDSEMLGRIKVPRKFVTSLGIGSASVPPPARTNSLLRPMPATAGINADTNALSADGTGLVAALRALGGNTNFIGEIRQKMLTGSPEASAKYDELINGLLSGKLNLSDLRQQAQTSAEQLKSLKRELGSDAGDSLDGYLELLERFLNEVPAAASNVPPSDAAPTKP
jgi:hypothetical protein